MRKTLMPLLLMAAPAWGESDDWRTVFQLLDNCAGMRVVVHLNVSENDKRIDDLTDAIVRNAVESRVRAANLYATHAPFSLLYVTVQIVSHAFATKVSVQRTVEDPMTGLRGNATMWTTGNTGTHADRSDYVMASVTEQMDEFLTSYLRVNEQACEEKRAAEYAARQEKPLGSGIVYDPSLFEDSDFVVPDSVLEGVEFVK